MQEVVRRIDVGAVVGTHGKGGQVVKVTGSCGTEGLPFRLWIAGIENYILMIKFKLKIRNMRLNNVY
jgi:hypothetical protein